MGTWQTGYNLEKKQTICKYCGAVTKTFNIRKDGNSCFDCKRKKARERTIRNKSLRTFGDGKDVTITLEKDTSLVIDKKYETIERNLGGAGGSGKASGYRVYVKKVKLLT